MGGCLVRCAQSRGECPGSRITFLEGRWEDGRVEVVGEGEGGARREDAADGGGRRDDEPPVGRGRRDDDVMGGTPRPVGRGFGVEGGGMRLFALGRRRGPGRAGVCMAVLVASWGLLKKLCSSAFSTPSIDTPPAS